MPSPGVKFSQFAVGGAPLPADTEVGLRTGVNTSFSAGGAIAPFPYLQYQIHQVAHGFVPFTILAMQAGLGICLLADAASLDSSNVIGIVSSVIDADNFILQIGGLITGFPTVLNAGTVYYLDPDVPGGYTPTRPTTSGLIRKSLFIVDPSQYAAVWLNYPGQLL